MATKKPGTKNEVAVVKPKASMGSDLASLVDGVDTEAAIAAARQAGAAERMDLEQDLSRPRINLSNINMIVGADSFDCIIIHHHRNKGYWKSEKPIPGTRPDCYSIDGRTGKGNNGKGEGEHQCLSCIQNRFGSRGKAKACKDTRILLLHRTSPRDETTPAIEQMQIAPTSVGVAAKYLQDFLTDDELYFGYVTHITAIKDPKTGRHAGWQFERGDKLDDQSMQIAAALNFKHREDYGFAVDAFVSEVDVSETTTVD